MILRARLEFEGVLVGGVSVSGELFVSLGLNLVISLLEMDVWSCDFLTLWWSYMWSFGRVSCPHGFVGSRRRGLVQTAFGRQSTGSMVTFFRFLFKNVSEVDSGL